VSSTTDRSTGKHWTGVSIPDDLAPGLPPQPSEGQAGPPMSSGIVGYQERQQLVDELGRKMALETRPDFVVGVATAQTDNTGAVDFIVYQVSAGMEARLHRATLNAVNPATNANYSFAAPYSNANGLLEIHVVDSVNGIGLTSLADGGPPTAAGPIFPAVLTDNSTQSILARGPMMFVVRIKSGPASAQIMCRYQISLMRAKGVA